MTSPSSSEFPNDYRSLLAIRELEGLILRRREVTRDILQDVHDLQEVLESMVMMLELELAR